MVSSIRVLGISGSLRRASYNTALLRAAGELMPEGMTLDIFDLRPIPMYDDDVRVQGFPPAVADLRARLAAADALLIATPEYNYAYPGVLKNAIDWASRPPDQPFYGKPLAIMGGTPGTHGTARGQFALRQVFVYLNVFPVNKPEVLVSKVHEKFDAEGRLTDEATRGFIRELMVSLGDLARRLSGPRAP